MIYCVEDDNSIRDLMIYTLTLAGFETKGFADSKSFWEGIKERQGFLGGDAGGAA